jgi:hypothetical protein
MMREVVFWWILKKQYMRAAITGHILFLKNKIWCWKLVCVSHFLTWRLQILFPEMLNAGLINSCRVLYQFIITLFGYH